MQMAGFTSGLTSQLSGAKIAARTSQEDAAFQATQLELAKNVIAGLQVQHAELYQEVTPAMNSSMCSYSSRYGIFLMTQA